MVKKTYVSNKKEYTRKDIIYKFTKDPEDELRDSHHNAGTHTHCSFDECKEMVELIIAQHRWMCYRIRKEMKEGNWEWNKRTYICELYGYKHKDECLACRNIQEIFNNILKDK